MSAPRDPYELEAPRRRSVDEPGAGRRARQLRARLQRFGTHPKPLGTRRPRAPRSPFAQRSTVKVSFRKNLGGGEWRAHGRYIARESARPDAESRGLGFDATRDDIPVPGTLAAWEKAGDPVLWKIVVSPENGARMDLQRHARGLVGAMQRDLGTRLEWVAVEHDHNDHPHLHIAIRGVRDDGSRLGLPGEYLRHGIRGRSEELATRELGPRTSRDQVRAREAGVRARHVGALDREIERQAGADRRVAFGAAAGGRQPESSGLAPPRVPAGARARDSRGPALLARCPRSPAGSSDHSADARPAARARRPRGLAHRCAAAGAVDGARARPGGDGADRRRGSRRSLGPRTPPRRGDRWPAPRDPADAGDGAAERGGRPSDGDASSPSRRARFERDGGPGIALEVEEHGRLEELRAAAEPTTVLDREVVRLVQAPGTAQASDGPRSRFSEAWREARRERVDLLVRAGALEENRARASVYPVAEEDPSRWTPERREGN